MSDIFRGMRADQKQRRAKRLPVRVTEILLLREDGFKVEQMTEYQFRVNDRLDLFPVHNRFHDIKTNKRGDYRRAAFFVQQYFDRLKQEENDE